MTLSTWLAFVAVSLLTTFSPGPALLLTLSNSASQGVSKALVAVLGNVLGIFSVSLLCAAGLNAILQASAQAFWLIKIIGAVYLIYLGLAMWRQSANKEWVLDADTPHKSASALVLKSYLIAITNPKAILFFSALFPQFMPAQGFDWLVFAQLTATFTLCAMLAHLCYAMGTTWIMAQFKQPQWRKRFQRTVGSVFVLLGLSLLRLKNRAS